MGRAKEYYLNIHYPALGEDLHVRLRSAGPLSHFEFERQATYSDGPVPEFDDHFVACGSDPFEATRFFTRERRQAMASIAELITYVSENELTCAVPGKLKPDELTELASRISQVAGVLVGPDRPRACLLYTSPSPRDATLSRMPSSA